MSALLRRIGSGALILLLAAAAGATTWVDVEVTCPVCGTVNVFQTPGSYGSYVFHEPSKFQYVFWPATTDRFLYTCKRCHLTAYMGEFEEIPKERAPELAAMLELEAKIEVEAVPYYDVPMVIRLPIAEKVYEILGRDRWFWCEFRRVEGFHLEAAGRLSEARRARKQALALAEELLEVASSTRKEALVVAASMRLVSGDTEGARRALREAEGLRYESAELGPEGSAGLDAYLGELIQAFWSERLSK